MISPTCLVISLLLLAATVSAAEITLEGEKLSLRFDGATGEWTGVIDKQTGRNLATGCAPGAPADLALPQFDLAALNLALVSDRTIAIDGTWRFAREPESADEAALAAASFNDKKWATTPVPSREDVGDKKLRNQIGAFWYRRAFTPPAAWAGRDLALVMGAVDDFDTTYVNGRRVGTTNANTPRWWEAPRRYVIPAALVKFGEANTLAVRVVNKAFDGGIAGPVMIGLADALPAPAPQTRVIAHSIEGSTLRMSLRCGDWLVHSEYALQPNLPAISRRFTIENASAKTQTLRGAACALPPLSAGPESAAIFPDSLPEGDRPIDQIGEDAPLHPTSENSLVYLYSAPSDLGLGTWYYSEDEYAHVSVSGGKSAGITHNLRVLARLEPGQKIDLGTQYLWLQHGSRNEALASVRNIYKLVNLRAPEGSFERLRGQVFYCGHPGGMPEQQYRGYGGFKALEAYLPTLRKMGVDVLWLLPIFEHGDGKKWNLYSPFDHFKISPLYGTEDELRHLGKSAKSARIDLMFDLVPHGPPEDTPLAKEHPDWVCLKEDGSPTHVWGQLAFDNAHPGWQQYMARAAEHHAREFGVVGARVDVAAGSPPNWNPKTGNRPSHSTLGGGLGMDKTIRAGFSRVRPDLILLPEEYTGHHLFHRDADLTYDAQLFYLFVELEEKKASPEQWAQRLQRFLHDQSLALPPGALKMRWTANHDTVSWTFQKKRTREAYGPARARALLALCCLIEGVPMIYQGEEDPALYGGKGAATVEYLGTIIAARKRLNAIARGQANYQSVHATGGTFACLRQDGNETAIVLISLNPKRTTTTVSLATGLDKPGLWRDELTGDQCSLDGIGMDDHQVRILTPASFQPRRGARD